MVKAVLSTTLLQHTGSYAYLALTEAPDVRGVPHYIGHPAIRFLLDKAGAVYTAGLFAGIGIGESFFVAQLRDPRKGQAFTVDQPGITDADLKWGEVLCFG